MRYDDNDERPQRVPPLFALDAGNEGNRVFAAFIEFAPGNLQAAEPYTRVCAQNIAGATAPSVYP